MKLTFFRSPSDLRKWFEKNAAKAQELWVGYYKKNSGKPSITWSESVDEALCFGWIDGIRQSVDGQSYKIRFTPRKPYSIWSNVNIKRAQALVADGRMTPAGLEAFEARKENKSGIYSYEQRGEQLPAPYLGILKKDKAAWEFFQKQPPWYRKAANWWVISAKQEETRKKRLESLIEHSAQGRTIPPLTRRTAKAPEKPE
jgi:uncharacterized protein YdeI (YjbR/CyaY-like superfamily)